MTARVGVIGLGEIGRVHLEALARVPRVQVVGTFDPRGSTHASIDDLVAAGAETLIVATPTPTHAEVCRDVRRIAPTTRVLVEKPLATDMADVESLLPAGNIEVLYHVAYAPEVAWGRGICDAVATLEGGITDVESHFSDLVADDEREHARDVLVSSWLDVGINALSVLSQFVDLTSLVIDRADHTAGDYRATLTFGEEVEGTGRLTTAWRGDEKWTTIRFRSGAELHLDHQQVSGRLTSPRWDASFNKAAAVPRLIAHYAPMFAELLTRGRRRFTAASDLALHRLLLSPPCSSPGSTS
jgi:hypothetical protein